MSAHVCVGIPAPSAARLQVRLVDGPSGGIAVDTSILTDGFQGTEEEWT